MEHLEHSTTSACHKNKGELETKRKAKMQRTYEAECSKMR